MNRLPRRKINLKRKDQFNKKLAFQVVFSIVIVAAVIITKQLDTELSKQFLNAAEQQMSENIEPKEVGSNVFDFMTGIKNKIPFLSKDASEFAAPVNGRIHMSYGLVKSGDSSYYNHGLDIISNTQSVRAISKGKVTQIGNNEKLSNYVVVEEDDKTIIYGKISEAFVSKGDKVSKGDIIGALNEENMILHVEVWENGESINPTKLFNMNE